MSSSTQAGTGNHQPDEWFPDLPGPTGGVVLHEFSCRISAGLPALVMKSTANPDDLFSYMTGSVFQYTFPSGTTESFLIQTNSADPRQRRAVTFDSIRNTQPQTLEQRKEYWSGIELETARVESLKASQGVVPVSSTAVGPSPEEASLWGQLRAWVESRTQDHSALRYATPHCPICYLSHLVVAKLRPSMPDTDQELTVVLPCGHMVGADCWLEYLKQHRGHVYVGNEWVEADYLNPIPLAACPMCGLPLYYTKCGHVIQGILAPANDAHDTYRVPTTMPEGLSVLPERCRCCEQTNIEKEALENKKKGPEPGVTPGEWRDFSTSISEARLTALDHPNWGNSYDHEFEIPPEFPDCSTDALWHTPGLE